MYRIGATIKKAYTMAIETRNGHTYFYTYKKLDGRCVKHYQGAGEWAEQLALEHDLEVKERLWEKRRLEDLQERLVEHDDQMEQLVGNVLDKANTLMLVSGYHRPGRKDWRRRRDG
jgi:hypothetical protein